MTYSYYKHEILCHFMIPMFSTLYTALINCYSNSTERNGSRKNNNGVEAKSLLDFFFFVFSVHWSTIAWKSLLSVTRGLKLITK